MAAKLVENIWINNGKPFIFQYFTETFTLLCFAEDLCWSGFAKM